MNRLTRFNFFMSAAQKSAVQEIADKLGVSTAHVLRLLLDAGLEHARRTGRLGPLVLEVGDEAQESESPNA